MLQETTANNKRIAKNTLLLYFRMFLIMGITLYTSRIVLNTLGVEGYGIYNVVGGVVAMFGFLNSAMSTATQRYLTFGLGKDDNEGQVKVFNTSIQIHAVIAIVVLLLAETIGLWFLCNKMVIPASRLDAAMWVYQCAVVSSLAVILSVPFNALIIAHEKMSAFAYISIIEVVLKLLIVYILVIFDVDKLKLYACLILGVQLLVLSIYIRYCLKHFAECFYKNIFEKPLFKEMLAFAGWNLWGNCAGILFSQGLNLLLNVFFGPVVNAARAVAVQVESAIQQFSTNFQMAINPQITKTYAQGDLETMHKLIFRSSRFTLLLLLLLSLPIMMEAPVILKLWLKQVPEHTVSFFIIMMCTIIIDSMAKPLMQAATATGRVKKYQSIVGGVLLSIVPIAYLVLKLGGNPESVFVVHLVVCCIAFVIRLYIIRPLIKLNMLDFFKNVLGRAFAVTLISVVLSLSFKAILPEGIISAIIVCVVSACIVASVGFTIGMEASEKAFILDKASKIFRRR